jgi:folate-binding protein YgfZ
MSSHWQSFLSTIGARIENGHSLFENPPTETSLANYISPLYQYGLLSIKGPDTAKFLQGQTTCDINSLSDSNSVFGAFCTPKGRMVTSFLIARKNSEHYLLRMRRDIVETSQATFGKYIVFSKATQSNASDEYIILGLAGDNARTAVEAVFQQSPAAKNDCVNHDNNLAIQLDEEGKVFECWIHAQLADQYWQQLTTSMTAVGSEYWALETIRRGIGEVNTSTSGDYIPQTFNFELTDHINFTKGCYTGQEIVARLHYRGKSKRRLYRASISSSQVQDGDELYVTGSEQSIGNIINHASINDSEGSEVLAVISTQHATEDLLLGKNGPVLQALPLPYAITNEDSN